MSHSSGEAAVVPAAGAGTITCLRSFGSRGIPTIVVSPDPDATAFASRYCDEALVVPSPFEDLGRYKHALHSIARRNDVRTIVPMQEVDVYVLSKWSAEFEDHVEPLWPAWPTLETALDRVRLVESAQAAGVPTPVTETLDDVDDWNRELIVKARYPVLVDERAGSDRPPALVEPPSTRYLDPGSEPDRERLCAEMGHVPIVQEYVPGTEYAFWALYDRGTPVATCHKRQVRGDSYAGGVSSYRTTDYEPELGAVGRALLDALDWHGFASAQFIRDAETGAFKLLEINPRVWVSLSCAVRAGLDFPYYYWRLAGDESVPRHPRYDVAVGTHNLSGEFAYLRSIVADDFPGYVDRPSLRAAGWDILSSLYSQPNVEYLYPDDPLLFLDGLGRKVRTLPPALFALTRRLCHSAESRA